MSEESNTNSNQLGNQRSPYLLQHKDNPVWWQPWGEEAFTIARTEQKPIFLSIGYATCHWCHVMEHESFEDQAVADLLNKHFVSIKVDREELPDVDQVYMRFVQGMTGHGGWPMTVIMTPQAEPFFGGTYSPKPNLIRLLTELSTVWQNEREQALDAAKKITAHFSEIIEIESDPNLLNPDLLKRALEIAVEEFDETHAGFGAAPKFPPALRLQLLLRIYRRNKDPRALKIVEETLKNMAYGGIYDHLAGGFARYTTDAQWIVPHFEKMLYDNALLAKAYLECFQLTKNKLYLAVATETLNYVLNDMTHTEGGFYSAEDADSEGAEGKFYVWKFAELQQVLSTDEFALLQKYYSVTAAGNFEDQQNILTFNKNFLWREKQQPELSTLHKKLLQHRNKRIRPLCDDKILCSWNGLMIDAMAHCYRVTRDKSYLRAAQKAALFIKNKLYSNGQLLRRYRDGEAKIDAKLDDFAFLIRALLSLYQADFDSSWILWAKELQDLQDQLLWDKEKGGYWYSSADLIIKLKDFYDGAEPNPNAYAAWNLLQLSTVFQIPKYREQARKILELNAVAMTKYAQAFSGLLAVYDLMHDREKELVVAIADKDDDLKDKILDLVWNSYQPNLFLTVNSKSDLPLTQGKLPVQGKTTLYMCEYGSCKEPSFDLAVLQEFLTARVKY